MRRKNVIFCAAILALFLATPIVSSAASDLTTPLNQEVTSQMQDMRRSSWELRKTVDRLHGITRSGGHSWQSHSWQLNAARENVNQLGKMLANLEDLKQYGTRQQQIAIEHIRPKLVQTATSLTNAIELLNDQRSSVYFPEYRDVVRTVNEQSESLHELLDAVVKYEAAKEHLDSFELGFVA